MRLSRLVVAGLLIFTWVPQVAEAREFPYKQAGLSKHDAAVHLLNRFSFGPRPGDVEQVMKMGLERWMDRQLVANEPDQDLDARLQAYPALQLSERDMRTQYLQGNQLQDLAVKDGAFPKPPDNQSPDEKKATRAAYMEWAKSHGLHDVGELREDLMAQKLMRALYSRNQLHEVMTDFWFNHFNVNFYSAARSYVLSYERDAIRPRAMGTFYPLLIATAKHPAMLAYLSNAQSVANVDEPTTVEMHSRIKRPRRKGTNGLNENYGREVMELHTLGVDGGYKQHDVTEVARALTGWTIFPMDERQEKERNRILEGRAPGSIVQGDFLFRGEAHDAGAKTILGRHFGPGGGLREGEEVLKMLAEHPSTAHFISKELAIRFVSDNPPESLVRRMADTFRRTHGNTREILRTLVQSPEFWAREARGAKVKSPFELLASSMRALNAEVEPGQPCYYWLDRMGQPLYAYAPPTGYPDKAASWVNSGTLTYRMNYALTLASGRIRGVAVDLNPFGSPGPQTAEQELDRVARILLTGRDIARTLADLRTFVKDPDFPRKVAESARKKARPGEQPPELQPAHRKPPQLSLVVGILIGSPEFQKR